MLMSITRKMTLNVVPGRLVYRLKDNLLAVPFTLEQLEATGKSVSLVEGVLRHAISDSGTLVYIPGTSERRFARTLVWVDRKGKEEPLMADPNNYQYRKISPDGTRVALTIADKDNEDIHIRDLVRENMMKLTFDEADDSYPLWAPDSKRIVFASTRTANAS